MNLFWPVKAFYLPAAIKDFGTVLCPVLSSSAY